MFLLIFKVIYNVVVIWCYFYSLNVKLKCELYFSNKLIKKKKNLKTILKVSKQTLYIACSSISIKTKINLQLITLIRAIYIPHVFFFPPVQTVPFGFVLIMHSAEICTL